jgi:hypothetical protein
MREITGFRIEYGMVIYYVWDGALKPGNIVGTRNNGYCIDYGMTGNGTQRVLERCNLSK